MWVELTSKLMYKLWAVEWIRERSSDQNSFFVPWRVLLFQGRCLWSWSEVPEEEESVRSLKGSPSRCRPAEPANALPARRHREKSAKKWFNTRPNSVIHGADVDFFFSLLLPSFCDSHSLSAQPSSAAPVCLRTSAGRPTASASLSHSYLPERN